MEYAVLGKTDLKVSRVCLGTMTFGEQNNAKEAFEQLDYVLDRGVNFVDTAELYSIPARAETYGATESIIGSWMKQRQNRSKVVIASKIAGPAKFVEHIRGGGGFSSRHIRQAIEGSLARLQTDYIDLYQLHWPERKTNFFGQLEYRPVSDDPWTENFLQVCEELVKLKAEGKIRHFGVSNETPWGMMKWLNISDQIGIRCASVQNPYHLLNRSFEMGMSEICLREEVSLLTYSPLAFGVLSGKYLGGQKPVGARLTLFPQYGRYANPQALEATARYKDLAQEWGVSLPQLALAFAYHRPFVTSTIIGATKMHQLVENLDAYEVLLTENQLREIDRIHRLNPNPGP